MILAFSSHSRFLSISVIYVSALLYKCYSAWKNDLFFLIGVTRCLSILVGVSEIATKCLSVILDFRRKEISKTSKSELVIVVKQIGLSVGKGQSKRSDCSGTSR